MDRVSVVLLLLAFVVLALSCAAGGEAWGRRAVRRDPKRKLELSGYVVGSHLGLVSFLIAITFGASMARLDARRNHIVAEANAIGTAELRARMLPRARAERVRQILIAYAEARLVPTSERHRVAQALEKSGSLLDELWQQTLLAVEAGEPNAPMLTLFVNSVNAVIDESQHRAYVVLRDRIPTPIWWTLAFVSLSAFFTLGYERALRTHRTPGIAVLAVSLALVLALIEDLDRPYSGLARIDQSPMTRTLEGMKAEERAAGRAQ
jgi:hypothetical protein